MPYEPVPYWGLIPHGMSFHGDAASVAVDSRDRVYTFNRGTHPLMVFDSEGNLLETWGDREDPRWALVRRPHSVQVDEDDNLWLIDDGGHWVQKRSPKGDVILTLGNPDQPAEWQGGGIFNGPTDIAVHRPTGHLFVSDGYHNSRVHRFDEQGRHVMSWGEPGSEPGQFSLPHGIAVTPDDHVVVCDRENFRIQVFDLDGRFVRHWPMHRPTGISVGPDGLLYIAEAGPRQVQRKVPNLGRCVRVVDIEGNLVERIGHREYGHEVDKFVAIHGVAVDSQRDIYVAECRGTSLTLYNPEELPRPTGEPPSLRKWRRLD